VYPTSTFSYRDVPAAQPNGKIDDTSWLVPVGGIENYQVGEIGFVAITEEEHVTVPLRGVLTAGNKDWLLNCGSRPRPPTFCRFSLVVHSRQGIESGERTASLDWVEGLGMVHCADKCPGVFTASDAATVGGAPSLETFVDAGEFTGDFAEPFRVRNPEVRRLGI
jgi:hypothetical protein